MTGNRERPAGSHADSVERARELFADLIAAKRLRTSQARDIVFDEVFSRHDHFTADQLAEDLSRARRHVSRSTVYNVLALLKEAGLVGEVLDEQGRIHYEHTFGHPQHEHMICDRCGAFFEFSDDALAETLAKNCERTGFVPRGHRVTVFGVCREFAEGGPSACSHYRRLRGD